MPYKDPIKRKQYSKEYNKEYLKTEKGHIISTIANWKRGGLICDSKDDYELIYFTYLNSSHCEKCNKEYSKKNKKCMDHDHKTGLFRNILCNSCNCKIREKKNMTGIPNIHKHKKYNSWIYRIIIQGKLYQKQSKNLEWLKNYKKEFEKENLYNI